MRITIIFFTIIFTASFFNCKKTKTDEEIIKVDWKLTQETSLNKEKKKLFESLKTAKTDFERAGIYTKIAVIETEKGNITSSLKSAQQAVKYQPNRFMSHYLLGKTYNSAGRFNDAENELLASIRMNGKYAHSHFELGNTFYKKRNYIGAINEYKTAVSIDPEHKNALNNLGVLYNISGNKSEAEKTFKALIKVYPDFAIAYKNLGIIYDTYMGEKDRAVLYFKKYLQLRPNCPERRFIKEWISELGG